MEYNNVYVAVCDILGFKEIIKNNDFKTSKKILLDFIAIIERSVTGGKGRRIEFQNKFFIGADTEEIKLNFNLFADTVVLWTLDDNIKSFFNLLIGTINLFNNALLYGLPLRGAITQGDLWVDQFKIESKLNTSENIILGKSILEAFELEQDQLWSGCVVNPLLQSSKNKGIRIIFENKLVNKFYLFYNVPLKSTGCRELLTLNWIDWNNYDTYSENSIRELFALHNKRINDDINIKIENTIAYYQYSKKVCKKYFAKNRDS